MTDVKVNGKKYVPVSGGAKKRKSKPKRKSPAKKRKSTRKTKK